MINAGCCLLVISQEVRKYTSTHLFVPPKTKCPNSVNQAVVPISTFLKMCFYAANLLYDHLNKNVLCHNERKTKGVRKHMKL